MSSPGAKMDHPKGSTNEDPPSGMLELDHGVLDGEPGDQNPTNSIAAVVSVIRVRVSYIWLVGAIIEALCFTP